MRIALNRADRASARGNVSRAGRACRLAAFAWSIVGIAASASADQLRVGALNIEHLGNPNSRGSLGKGVAQKPEDLADYIKRGNVDILTLSEISDDDDDDQTRTNTTLTQTMELLSDDNGQEWDHVLLPKKNTRQLGQLTGVAWNKKKVRLVGTPFRIPGMDVPNNGSISEWDRAPHAVQFSAGPGRSDIVVIPVHMKANVGGEAKAKAQRALEASLLAAKLQDIRLRFEDDDILILGDANCLNRDEAALQTFVGAGFRDLNNNDDPTNFNGPGSQFDPAPFDRILVSAGRHSKEFTNSQFVVLTPTDRNAHRKLISDHFMVVTTLEVIDDEDVIGDGSTDDGDSNDGDGDGPVTTGVRIIRLLPNPAGDESQEETITLKNFGNAPADLSGWKLRDKAKTTWSLDSLGTLNPGQERTIRRDGQRMALGNAGDTVTLLDGTTVVDQVNYEHTTEGQEIVIVP